MKALSIFTSSLCLLLLAAAPACFGQQQPDDVWAELSRLKQVVADQDRRISELEKALRELQPTARPTPPKPVVSERVPPAPERPPVAAAPAPAPAPSTPGIGGLFRTTKPTGPPAWTAPAAWARLKQGMSRAQVEAVLGGPASVDADGHTKTLIYRDAPGSSSLTGKVKLTDDRVVNIQAPAF